MITVWCRGVRTASFADALKGVQCSFNREVCWGGVLVGKIRLTGLQNQGLWLRASHRTAFSILHSCAFPDFPLSSLAICDLE
jgi:hypothetical protein